MATGPIPMSICSTSDAKQETQSIYAELEESAKQVAQVITTDEKYPELYELVQDQSEMETYFFEPYHSIWNPQLQCKTLDSRYGNGFPSAIGIALDQLKQCMLMGLLPELHMGWIAIDDKLFLWDYTDNTSIAASEEFEQIISSVTLLRPKANIFKDNIRYLLAVATSVEVYLMGIAFENNDAKKGALILHKPTFKISTDNISYRKMIGTSGGRVFMGGSDNTLHEFTYNNDGGFLAQMGLQSNCANINHSVPPLSKLFQSAANLFKSKKPEIIDMAIDNERNILYTLNTQSYIGVWDLGVDGNATILLGEMDAFELAVKWSTASNAPRGSRPDPVNFRSRDSKVPSLKSIRVVARDESAYIHLVGVTNLGIRIYFSTFDINKFRSGGYVPAKTRPTTLKVAHVRLPPPYTSLPEGHHKQPNEGVAPAPKMSDEKGSGEIALAFYSHGVFLASETIPDQHDRVIGIAQDLITRSVASRSKQILRESVSRDPFYSKVWQIEEYQHTSDNKFNSTKISNNSNVGSKRSFTEMRDANPKNDRVAIVGELTTQFSMPQRVFICLTSNGLHTFVKLRPIDQLERIIRAEDWEQLGSFKQYFGIEQTCAMLFGIACGIATENGLIKEDSVRLQAMNIAIGIGGNPGVQDYTPQMGASSGRLVMTNDMFKSSHHDGLMMFVARILRPIWSAHITGSIPVESSKKLSQKEEVSYFCALSRDELVRIQTCLTQLKLLMGQIAPYEIYIRSTVSKDSLASIPPSRANEMTQLLKSNASRVNGERVRQEDAIKAEQRSIRNLYGLVCRSIQALALLIIASDYPTAFSEKTKMTFSDLAVTTEGFHASGTLINRMMKKIMNEPGKVQSMVQALRRACPNFFSLQDQLQYEGEKILDVARTEVSHSKQKVILQDTLEKFIKAAKSWNTMDSLTFFENACKEYMRMHYFTGIVDLSLVCASNFPKWETNREMSTSRELVFTSPERVQNPDGNIDISSIHPGRKRCYQFIFDGMQILLNPAARSKTELTTVADDERKAYFKQMKAQAIASTDKLFHHVLYGWLLEQNHPEAVVDVQSPFIEQFLQAHNDELLSNYYVRRQEYGKASEVMYAKAHFKAPVLEDNPSIGVRLEYLSRAYDYGGIAVQQGRAPHIQNLAELQDEIDVLRLQTMVLDKLRTDQPTSEANALRLDDIRALTYTPIDVSDLYNRYARKYQLWDVCLMIMQTCRSDYPKQIRKHWSQLIFSHIPVDSLHSTVAAWMRGQVDSCGTATLPTVQGRFEDGKWINAVQRQVRTLGTQLYQEGAEFAFPVTEIAEILEMLWIRYVEAASTTNLISKDVLETEFWIVQLLKSTQIPYGVIFDSYSSLYHSTAAPDWRLHILLSVCFIIENWRNEAIHTTTTTIIRESFAQFCPKMVQVLEAFMADVQATAPHETHYLEKVRQQKHQLLSFREEYMP